VAVRIGVRIRTLFESRGLNLFAGRKRLGVFRERRSTDKARGITLALLVIAQPPRERPDGRDKRSCSCLS
jgi:hypothetical protein